MKWTELKWNKMSKERHQIMHAEQNLVSVCSYSEYMKRLIQFCNELSDLQTQHLKALMFEAREKPPALCQLLLSLYPSNPTCSTNTSTNKLDQAMKIKTTTTTKTVSHIEMKQPKLNKLLSASKKTVCISRVSEHNKNSKLTAVTTDSVITAWQQRGASQTGGTVFPLLSVKIKTVTSSPCVQNNSP